MLRREHGELNARAIDVDPSAADWATACAAEILFGEEDQVALRGERRLAARLTAGETAGDAGRPNCRRPVPRRSRSVSPSCVPGGPTASAAFRRPGGNRGPARWRSRSAPPRSTPRTRSRRLYAFPGPPDEAAAVLGDECMGRVVAVGPDVALVSPGDRVAACVPGALACHVTVPAARVLPVPGGLDDAQAAGLPLVMAMAWYMLVDHGRVSADDTVLIQAAADTVGLAAVHVARLLGARVLATADTEGKRAHLRKMGISGVFDSRDLSWAEGVRAATEGRGVDVVLNFLPGAAISAGLDVLAPGGRFVEATARTS